MNFKPLMFAAAAALMLQSVQASEIRQVDGIAAIVGNEAVTHRDVRQGIAEARSRLGKNADETELRRQVLQRLIDQTLIAQAGKRRNIGASDAEIDAALADIARSRKTDLNGLYAQAAKSGVSKTAMRRSVADSIIVRKVQQQAVMQQSRVSDAEIDAVIAHAKRQGAALPQGEPLRQYRAQHILLKAENGNAVKAAESSIRKIYDQARSGADFSALARQYSQDGSAVNGGDLGWFSDGQMVSEFENAVHGLKPGQVSRPVRSQFGWHVIKLNDVREAGTPEERQREAVRRHIVHQRAEQAAANLLQELRQNTYVEIR